jgi:hypothetical protein
VAGAKCVEAAALCLVGLAVGLAAVALADDRLLTALAIAALAVAVGAVVAVGELDDLREAAAEAPVADPRSSRFVDRGDHLFEAASWRRVLVLFALLPLDHTVGAVDRVGRPVVLGAAGLVLGLGIAAGAAVPWVRRWERRERLTLYMRDVQVRPRAVTTAVSARPPTAEEAERVRRAMMGGQGLDARDRAILDRITAAKAAEKAAKKSPDEERQRQYLVVPHPGRIVIGRSIERPPSRVAAEPPPGGRLT